MPESWIQLELIPPLGVADDQAYAALEAGLREVLNSVAEAVEDWQLMRQRMDETVRLLQERPVPYPYAQVRSAMELLNWLGDDHFTFLGYREYEFLDGEAPRLEAVPGSGLGVLRDNHHGEVALGPDAAAYVPVLGGFVRVSDRS